MSDRSAAVLTKSQRTRIRESFAGRSDAERRRDRQRIRERLAAGVLDAELLVAYPDEEFELALEDVPDEELRDALVDAAVTVERVRALRGVEREEFLEAVADRTTELEGGPGLDSLEDVDVRPPSTVRAATEARVRDELGPDQWDRRANVSFKLGATALLVLIAIGLVDSTTATNLLLAYNFVVVPIYLAMFGGFGAVLSIRGLRALKHDVVPFLRRCSEEPDAVAADAFGVLRRPGRTLRRLWRSL